MPFVMKVEGEGPNVSSTPVEVNVLPNLDKKHTSPVIGVYFKIVSDEQWSEMLEQSLDIKSVKNIDEKSSDDEDMLKYKDELKESIRENKDFEREKVREVVEKITCLTKDGISLFGHLYKNKDVMFEKTYQGDEDVTPVEQTKIRDAILSFHPYLKGEIWKKFREMMTGKKD